MVNSPDSHHSTDTARRSRTGAIIAAILVLTLPIATLQLLRQDEQVSELVHYTVLDRSGWAFAAIHRAAVYDDLEQLLARLDVSVRPLQPGLLDNFLDDIPPAGTPARAVLINDLAGIISRMRIEGINFVDPQTPTEVFVHWWLDSPGELAALYPDASEARFRFVPVPGANTTVLEEFISRGRIKAYFVIPDDPVETANGARFVTRFATGEELRLWLSLLATRVIQDRRIRELNVDAETARWIQQPVQFHRVEL